MLIQQHFAAAEYAASLNDFNTAFAQHKAGRECEQRLYVKTPLERSVDLKEQAGSHQSLNRLLLDLSNHEVIDHGELEPAFQLITRTGGQILAVSRVSLWLLDGAGGALVRRCVHAANGEEAAMDEPMRSIDFRNFFERLAGAQPLVAHDAQHHPHIAELVEPYLKPHDIRSMLMFPIRLAGKTIGALCFESVGAQHNWTQDDLLHGKQLAVISARVMSSYEHKIAREELRELQGKLSEMRQIAARFDLPAGGSSQ